MVTKTVVRSGVNPHRVRTKARPGECLVSEQGRFHCRGNRMVDGGADGIEHNTVLVKAGHFDGILLQGVPASETVLRGVVERGPCEVSLARLNLPVATSAVDGPDAGSDNTAELAAATQDLQELVLEEMAALGIVVRG